MCVTLEIMYLSQATEDGSSDEDLDDEAMMELDKNLAAVFLEQKKKTQAKKDEKTKIQKEKTLVRDFKIKVSYSCVLRFSFGKMTLISFGYFVLLH